MTFVESLRLAIALGLTLFLVLLRFDSERITRSDYFRYRTPWMGPVSYYILVIGFTIGIAIILPEGRETLFLTGGDTEAMLPVMLLFSVVALINGVALAFLRYGSILPLPTELLPSRVLGAAMNAISEELQFRSIVLGMLIFAGVPTGWAIAIQAVLYGLAHRRLWRERDWYFLTGSVLLGWAAGVATVADRVGDPGHRRALRGHHGPVRLRRRASAPATDLRPMEGVEAATCTRTVGSG